MCEGAVSGIDSGVTGRAARRMGHQWVTWGRGLLLGLALGLAAHTPQAHLMPDGQATLNVKGGAAFVALSLPVTWLGAVDDDRDGHLSPTELQAHREEILRVLATGLALRNGGHASALRDVLMSPSAAHDRADGAGTHLLVMGSAPLAQPGGPVGLQLQFQGPAQALTVTATRDPLKEQLTVAGPRGSGLFFASWWERWRERARAWWA